MAYLGNERRAGAALMATPASERARRRREARTARLAADVPRLMARASAEWVCVEACDEPERKRGHMQEWHRCRSIAARILSGEPIGGGDWDCIARARAAAQH